MHFSKKREVLHMEAGKKGNKKFNRFTHVPKYVNVILSVFFIFAAICCFMPFVFVAIISFTDQSSIFKNGYQFWPETWTLSSYTTLFKNSASLLNAVFISVFVTVVGTIIGVILNALMGYVLSRHKFALRNVYTYFVFIPMLFSGGLTASYLVNTQMLGLRNSVWALILPLAVNSFYIIVFRTFFTSTVPEELIESAKIDGATELRIFFGIVVPISKPVMATISLFLSFGYWNDWQNAQLYVNSEQTLWPMQYMLMRIEKDIMFLTNNPYLSDMTMAALRANLPEDGIRMALVVLTVIPIALIYPFFQRYFVSGLTVGAVKG